ncbi:MULTISPECIES: polysaccharide deacetylase family protein [unclassified Virgibacillus]|uniref:polysaccharide deacetylase family protein n=1 Tax=unclassified Virgibacillus TaxID=2620237 RepID=UPI0024DE043E|nr:polysaccharide deacetylase family protein [Virgibacillus sp. LDC-1]
MRRFRGLITLIVFAILFFTAYSEDYNPFTASFDQSLNTMQVVKKEAPLYKEIQAKAETYNKAPQDAYIDKVWKKTPGRNGLQVNISKSYQNMKKKGMFSEKLLVYDQLSPKVSLQDLPAAPIYRGHPEKKMVAFLINVSWGTEYVPGILSQLKKNNVKATFFIEGKWAKENADFVKMIDDEGHLIGNHAYNHPDMARISNQAILEQINQTNEILEAIIGKTPKWFAPPSGSFSDSVVEVAHNLKMETILWTVDTIDWKNPSVSVMMNRVMDKVHPGAMILMHPTASVEKGIDQMIQEIKKKGYKISTVDKLLSEDR